MALRVDGVARRWRCASMALRAAAATAVEAAAWN
jgi:hypothetical protein